MVESEAFFYLDAPVKRVCGLDVPIPYNPNLEAQVVPTEEKITAAIRELL
ncbi:MAG: transketolase C-terminal domain-containing protein [Sphaerochaetaceae bacterium]